MRQPIQEALASRAINMEAIEFGGGRSVPDEFYPKPPATETPATPPAPSETPTETEPCSVPSPLPEQVPEPKRPVVHPTPQPEVPLFWG